jgi:hypothetical protein
VTTLKAGVFHALHIDISVLVTRNDRKQTRLRRTPSASGKE